MANWCVCKNLRVYWLLHQKVFYVRQSNNDSLFGGLVQQGLLTLFLNKVI